MIMGMNGWIFVVLNAAILSLKDKKLDAFYFP